jgi:hypothetical protein
MRHAAARRFAPPAAAPTLLAAAAAATVLAACGQTGQTSVSYPIYGTGVAPAPFSAGDWTVTLDTAMVGFGPVYFCATASSSPSLCPSAVFELADAGTVDALDPTPQLLGTVTGFSGAVHSAAYDYAITWFTTQSQPTPTPAAPGGHSAHFEGTASNAATGVTFRFIADVDVTSVQQGFRTISGHSVDVDVESDTERLDVAFDAAAWWSGVDFDELAALGADPVIVPADSRANNAVVLGMMANARPVFVWSLQ